MTIQDVAHKPVTGLAHQPDDFVVVVETGKVEAGPYDLLIDQMLWVGYRISPAQILVVSRWQELTLKELQIPPRITLYETRLESCGAGFGESKYRYLCHTTTSAGRELGCRVILPTESDCP